MTPRVVVAGLGPGDPGLVSVAARSALDGAGRRFVRTTRHPSAALAEPARSFDDLYDTAPTIEAVYDGIVEELARAATADGQIVYAVPGSPLVAERTVELLRCDPRVETEIVPSLSFIDLVWDRLGLDPLRDGVRLVDGHRFAEQAAGQSGPFLVGQCDTRLVLSELKLAVEAGPRAIVMQRLGLADEAVLEVDWADLDRAVEADHLTCVWVPRLGAPVAAELTRLAELVRTLRAECPWDSRQTHESLTRHLIEETYEVLDAIGSLDTPEGYQHLEEELGDLLFQVAFHALLASEAGQFDLADVARAIHDKLVGRHPHVFGPPAHPVPNWEEQKKAEKGRASVMDGVPGHLPSLLYAFKMQAKAASVGFDWKNAAGAWPKVREELGELEEALFFESAAGGSGAGPAVNEELGDVLFSVVNVARHLGVDPETALHGAAGKFRARFVAMEALAAARRVEVSDELWDEVKAREVHTPPSPTEYG
ncbi:MAG: nucleoside triphosphate pyrophosphohydrolase [Acidimicrobiales bacterium]|nr:nucleoside triphosphate pyrophosphohydrolase [Acidimicrobiales bacterium]